MIKALAYLTLFSGFSFLFFGLACFLTKNMKLEFERYGLASYRKTVGALQLIGGLGLLIGMYYSPFLQIFAAAGLSILMLLGFLVRLKIKDTFLQAAPSLFYALLNAYIFYHLLSYW
ncbi:DoxX family protein [Maribacter aestuarii]|uniref:DoxX family protein n=1 Tax=Maribacter aestuarii TaxID=1130723 RepID=UPI00248B2852|nr:DoxX family protein [Maribacter aestuarii]